MARKKAAKKPAGKMPMKKMPKGMHRMPDGSLMSDAEMDKMMADEKPKRKTKKKGKKK